MTEPVAQAHALVELGIREAQRRGFNDTYTFTNDYIRLCQSEMRDNAAAYPRLIRRPLTQRWLGVHEDLAFYDALPTTRELAVVFSFYTAPRYVFDNARLLALAAELPEDERTRFALDPRRYDWAHYVQRVHLPGLERYAVRGEPLPRAPKNRYPPSMWSMQ